MDFLTSSEMKEATLNRLHMLCSFDILTRVKMLPFLKMVFTMTSIYVVL